VTRRDEGAGVRELLDRLLATDLRDLEPRLWRHAILLGTRADRTEVQLPPYDTSVLLAGSSGSGKSTLATGVLERLAEREYQFCVIDPEGDYSELEGAIVLGDSQREPSITEVFDVLAQPGQNVVVNLLGIELERRPGVLSRPSAATPGIPGGHRPAALDRCGRGPPSAAGLLACRRDDGTARARRHSLRHGAPGTHGDSCAVGH
jgi:hypothetical protein